ncbi:MAG: hypothetical protein DSY43_07200 [Gammaproteobacteria bacterium]|nr:MAG: hypothetical protein DSY43_07200 [Gammaproteobacteria bacterium]
MASQVRKELQEFLILIKQEWYAHIHSLTPFMMVGSFRTQVKSYERNVIQIMETLERVVLYHDNQLESSIQHQSEDKKGNSTKGCAFM